MFHIILKNYRNFNKGIKISISTEKRMKGQCKNLKDAFAIVNISEYIVVK
jgi:hypothetical protein